MKTLHPMDQPEAKSKELKRLQKEWYKKLKDDGFEDIEYMDKNQDPQEWLKGNSKFSPMYDDQMAVIEAEVDHSCTEDYFRAAADLLFEGIFDTEEDRYVWEMHSNGATLRGIAKEIGCSHPRILRIVNKYRKHIVKGGVK